MLQQHGALYYSPLRSHFVVKMWESWIYFYQNKKRVLLLPNFFIQSRKYEEQFEESFPPFFNTYRCHRVFDNEACTSWVKGRWVGMNGKARVARPLAHMIHKSQQRWGWKKERKKNSRRLAAYYYCTTCYSLSLSAKHFFHSRKQALTDAGFQSVFPPLPHHPPLLPSHNNKEQLKGWKQISFFLFGGSCGWIGVGKWADASHRSFWSTIESNRNGFIEPWKTYRFLFLLQKKK